MADPKCGDGNGALKQQPIARWEFIIAVVADVALCTNTQRVCRCKQAAEGPSALFGALPAIVRRNAPCLSESHGRDVVSRSR
jgi:hypothetical protein